MRRQPGLTPTEILLILWTVVLVFATWLFTSRAHHAEQPEPTICIRTVYVEVPVEVPAEPVTVYVEKKPEPDTCVPYYAEIADSITEEEIELLAKVTYLEAGNQSMTGQRAVVEVVLNRVMDDSFPNTVKEVLYQPGQFTTAPNLAKARPTEEQYRAVALTLGTSTPILEPHVMFFARGIPDWQIKYEKIGAHYFGYLKQA